jgi:hypothetical protein
LCFSPAGNNHPRSCNWRSIVPLKEVAVPEGPWYCVIRCRTFALVYLGLDQVQATKLTSDDTYCAAGPTRGEAQRKAAIGAGKKTPSRRPRPAGDSSDQM